MSEGDGSDETAPVRAEMHWISVVVPTKNRVDDLRSLLNAILPQLADEDEIIVIDNGSKDQTSHLLWQVTQTDHRLKVMIDDTANLSTILNRAIKLSKNDIIAMFNDDCVPVPTWVESVRRHLVLLPEAAVMGGVVRDTYDRRIVQKVKGMDFFRRVYDRVMMNGDFLKFGVIKEWGSFSVGRTPPPAAQIVTCLSAANMILPKTVLELSGAFDEDLRFNHFDGLLFIWLLQHERPVYYIPGADVIHNTGRVGATRSAYNIGLDTAIFLKKLRPRSMAGVIRVYGNVLAFHLFWLIRSRVEGRESLAYAVRGFLAGV